MQNLKRGSFVESYRRLLGETWDGSTHLGGFGDQAGAKAS